MLRLSCAALGLGTFFFSLSTVILLDDHFGRISPGRQIAQYGDLPFRDFLDPGYFLTEFSSAAVQWLFGDNLLGEGPPGSAFIASGTVLVFVLSYRVSASSITALATAVLALLLFPRAYDYDKVLFYPLGILLCWRYVDAPALPRIWALAAGAVAGLLYRYDTGIFLVGAAVVAMVILHAGSWATLARRLWSFRDCRRMLRIAVPGVPGYGWRRQRFGSNVGVRQTRNRPNAAVDTTPKLSTPGPRQSGRGAAGKTRSSNLLTAIDKAQFKVPSEPAVIRAQRAFPLLRVRLLPGAWHVGNADAYSLHPSDSFRLSPGSSCREPAAAVFRLSVSKSRRSPASSSCPLRSTRSFCAIR